MSHNVLLSERANLSFLRAVGRLPAQDVIRRRAKRYGGHSGATLASPRSTSSLARASCLLHLSDSEPISSALAVVACAAGGGVSAEACAGENDTTGRLTFQGRSGRVTARCLAFRLLAGSVTTRDRGEGSSSPREKQPIVKCLDATPLPFPLPFTTWVPFSP
jgi:hypothetical protein